MKNIKSVRKYDFNLFIKIFNKISFIINIGNVHDEKLLKIINNTILII